MRRLLLPLWLIAAALAAGAQEGRPQGDGSYLIPQTVFVGDKGRLALPVSPILAGARRAVVERPEALPQLRDLRITRVELENRGEGPRLLVDFTAFVPGIIELPPIEIASLSFTGLKVTVASILEAEGDSRVLSAPEPPLAVPGAAALIYGTVLALILLCILLALGGFRGLPALRRRLRGFRRRRLIRSMGRIIRQMRNRLGKGPPGGEGEVLSRLSGELRVFLGFFLGMNCRAMVPGEFRALLPGGQGSPLSGLFLGDLFQRCDTLRFSGGEIPAEEALSVLEEAGAFTEALDRAERAGEGGLGAAVAGEAGK
jgi:hypothetical protein